MKDSDRYHHGYLKKTMIEEGIKSHSIILNVRENNWLDHN